MMAGRGSTAAVGGPARHIPVMLSEVLAQLDPKDGEIIVDGTFGAGGYSQAILESRRLQDHRHRSRSRSLSPERRVGDSLSRKGAGGARPLQRDGRARRERRFQLRRRRRARSRRLLDAARRAGPRFLLQPGRPPRHAHGAGGPFGARHRQQLGRTGACRDSLQARRGAARPAPSPRPSSSGAPRRRSRPPRSSPISSPACSAARATRRSTPPPALFRACGFISTRSSTSSPAASPPPSVCWKRAAGLPSSPFIRSRTGLPSGSSPAGARRRRAPRAISRRREAKFLPRASGFLTGVR